MFAEQQWSPADSEDKKKVPVNCYLPVAVHKIPSNRHFHETQNQITRIKAQGDKRPSGLAKPGHKASN